MTIEELSQHAMEMIVHAGIARDNLNKALDALYDGNEEEYEEKMKVTKKEMVSAHAAQTDVLQQTINDTDLNLTILFTHAQDTLMTVMSEINTARHLAKILRKIQGTDHE